MLSGNLSVWLAQQVDFAGSSKRTDYAGEFIYENDVPQFISHEEGRIVVSGEKMLLRDRCDNAGNMTASNTTLATHSDNGEQYTQQRKGKGSYPAYFPSQRGLRRDPA